MHTVGVRPSDSRGADSDTRRLHGAFEGEVLLVSHGVSFSLVLHRAYLTLFRAECDRARDDRVGHHWRSVRTHVGVAVRQRDSPAPTELIIACRILLHAPPTSGAALEACSPGWRRPIDPMLVHARRPFTTSSGSEATSRVVGAGRTNRPSIDR